MGRGELGRLAGGALLGVDCASFVVLPEREYFSLFAFLVATRPDAFWTNK